MTIVPIVRSRAGFNVKARMELRRQQRRKITLSRQIPIVGNVQIARQHSLRLRTAIHWEP